ncbi:MAG: ATP synthase F1 subunit delta [Myxococcales bacterium]
MIDPSVARRYAKALLSLATAPDGAAANGGDPHGVAERTAAQLRDLAASLETSPDTRAALLNPGFSSAQRQKAVDALAQQLKLEPGIVNFLRLLLDRQRIAALPAIARAFGELLDQRIGRVRATVTSAQPLGEGELATVRDALSKAVQKSIILEAKTDPALLGGVVAQVGGTVFDGSVRTQLNRLRDELKQAPV